MHNLDNLKKFHRLISIDSSKIFDYLLVSRFERDLLLSIVKYIKNKYGYRMRNLKETHYQKLKIELDLDDQDRELIEMAIGLNTIMLKRTVTMGYGKDMKELEGNNEMRLLKRKLLNYIKLYEELTQYN